MLQQLRKEAEEAASTYQIVWEKFDNDPDGRAYFLRTLHDGIRSLDSLESLHAKLCNLTPNTPDSGGYTWEADEIERYRTAIEDELYGVYQLEALLARYMAIENTINPGRPLTGADGQYILDI